jgi:glycine oxidase
VAETSAQPVEEPPSLAAPTDADPDVVVLGAGTIGLSIAWKAASAGMRVTVIDPEPGKGASWAAAGMLAPVGEVHYGEESLLALNMSSARMWPRFTNELERAAGRTIGYRRTGTLVTALDQGDRAWLEQLFEFQRSLGLDVDWLSGRRVREMEPGVTPGVSAGMFAAGDHQVDNRLLVGALLEAATSAGCTILRERATSVELEGGRVKGVRVETGDALSTLSVVLATGCWSADMQGVPREALPPVRPVKGQILRLRSKDPEGFLRRPVRGIVNGAAVYLVPRADGEVVVGSTVEEMGFDTSVTAGAVYALLRDAHRVVPGSRELELSEAIARLRPGSPDNAPVIGAARAEGAEGLVVATGHYRNGILLTPVTAETVCAILTGADPPAEVAPFTPARFQVPSWSR